MRGLVKGQTEAIEQNVSVLYIISLLGKFTSFRQSMEHNNLCKKLGLLSLI